MKYGDISGTYQKVKGKIELKNKNIFSLENKERAFADRTFQMELFYVVVVYDIF